MRAIGTAGLVASALAFGACNTNFALWLAAPGTRFPSSNEQGIVQWLANFLYDSGVHLRSVLGGTPSETSGFFWAGLALFVTGLSLSVLAATNPKSRNVAYAGFGMAAVNFWVLLWLWANLFTVGFS